MNTLDKDGFSDYVQRKLKYYIYCLLDPKDDCIFYIGKGIGNRIFAHAQAALKKELESDKLDKIREIRGREIDNHVKYMILRHGIETEDEAYEYESLAIDLIKLVGKSQQKQKALTNIQGGSHANQVGLMSVEDIKRIYEPDILKTDKAVILITINKEYDKLTALIDDGTVKESDKPQEIYERTRKSWVVSLARANKAEYVIAVNRGYTVGAYKLTKWYKSERDEGRCEFVGEILKDTDPAYLELVGKSTKEIDTKGAQNPIRYVNC